jgi:hypothetical protein
MYFSRFSDIIDEQHDNCTHYYARPGMTDLHLLPATSMLLLPLNQFTVHNLFLRIKLHSPCA